MRTKGRMVQGRLLRLSVMQCPEGGEARLGVVTSRRVGCAVARNRMRRRIREIFRRRRASIRPGIWLVVTAKPGAGSAPFDEVLDEWLRLAERLSIFRGS